MSHIASHTTQLKKIPVKKRWAKLWSTLMGIGLIALASALEWYELFPAPLRIGLFVVGGYTIAGDYVRGLIGYLPAAGKDIGDFIASVKGKK